MNPWWLCLIIPVAIYVGFGLCALLVAAGRADWEQDRQANDYLERVGGKGARR